MLHWAGGRGGEDGREATRGAQERSDTSAGIFFQEALRKINTIQYRTEHFTTCLGRFLFARSRGPTLARLFCGPRLVCRDLYLAPRKVQLPPATSTAAAL
jgi:hypothetical protein